MSTSVQIHGPEMVLTCFIARGCPKWAIFVGRQFLFKCDDRPDMTESAAYLEEHLEMIGKSAAVYTLKVYEDPGKIKEKTPCDGSFNFLLGAEPASDYLSQPRFGESREILSRLSAIEQKLSAEASEADEPESSLGALGEILNNPTIMGLLAPVIQRMLNPSAPDSQPRPGAMAGVPGQVNGVQTEQEKLLAAINILKAADPAIADHLMKLAVIAKDSPKKFKGLISMLENF